MPNPRNPEVMGDASLPAEVFVGYPTMAHNWAQGNEYSLGSPGEH